MFLINFYDLYTSYIKFMSLNILAEYSEYVSNFVNLFPPGIPVYLTVYISERVICFNMFVQVFPPGDGEWVAGWTSCEHQKEVINDILLNSN